MQMLDKTNTHRTEVSSRQFRSKTTWGAKTTTTTVMMKKVSFQHKDKSSPTGVDVGVLWLLVAVAGAGCLVWRFSSLLRLGRRSGDDEMVVAVLFRVVCERGAVHVRE